MNLAVRAAKIRDKGMCRWKRDGCTKLGLECHHVFPRGSSREITWYMLANLASLCPSCHRYAQEHQSEFHRFWMGQIGSDYDSLEWLSKNAEKLAIKDYEDLITLYSGSV